MTTAAEIDARYGCAIAPGCVVQEIVAGETAEPKVEYRYSSRTGRIEAKCENIGRKARFMDPERAARLAARRSKVKGMIEAGRTRSEIAAALGVSRHVVRDDLTALGMVLDNPRDNGDGIKRDAYGNRADARTWAEVLHAFWFPVSKRAKPLSSTDICDRLKIARMRDVSATIEDLISRGLIERFREDRVTVYEVTPRGDELLRKAAGVAA